MPAVPAICDTCGTPFPSGIFTDNATNITFSNATSGPCPKCGGRGHILEGTFNFIGNTIEVIKASFRTNSDLARLQAFVTRIKKDQPDPQIVISQIAKEFPTLSRSFSVVPQTRTELYAFLGLLLALLTYLQTFKARQEPTGTFINNVYNNFYGTAEAKTKAPQIALKKIGRNETCPCGSGRKHKKCCGITP